MKIEIKLMKLSGLFAMLIITACAYGGAYVNQQKPVGVALPGTDTVTVGISLGHDGVPKVSVDPVIIKAGQRLVFIGPVRYMIEFPDGSPFKETRFSTDNAVINLELPEARKRSRGDGDLNIKQFKYNITVEDKVLDPYVVLIED